MALVQPDARHRVLPARSRGSLWARLKLRDDDRRVELARQLLQAGGYVADSHAPGPSSKDR